LIAEEALERHGKPPLPRVGSYLEGMALLF
jgi:hypothetical protein